MAFVECIDSLSRWAQSCLTTTTKTFSSPFKSYLNHSAIVLLFCHQVVEHLVNRTCKCHGVSGSCSVRTCWHQLAAFSETAAQIKSKYEGAVQVSAEIRENSVQLRPVNHPSELGGRMNHHHHHYHQLHQPGGHLDLLMMSNQAVTQNRAKKSSEGSGELNGFSAADRTGSKSISSKKELIFQHKSPDFCYPGSLGPGTTKMIYFIQTDYFFKIDFKIRYGGSGVPARRKLRHSLLRPGLQCPQDERPDALPMQIDSVLPSRVPAVPRGENDPHLQIIPRTLLRYR